MTADVQKGTHEAEQNQEEPIQNIQTIMQRLTIADQTETTQIRTDTPHPDQLTTQTITETPISNQAEHTTLTEITQKDFTQIERQRKSRKQTETHKEDIKIATINIRGRYKREKQHEKEDKIRTIINEIRIRNIGIIAIQETHTKEEETLELETCFPDLDFAISGDNSNKEGIMIITQKKEATIDKESIKEHQVGRMLEIRLQTKHKQNIRIIAIHAPNNQKDKEEFYNIELHKNREENRTIVMGDFNLCEETIDRQPISSTDEDNILALWQKTKEELELNDGWRTCNPDTQNYTFFQKTNRNVKNILARIDRIYHSDELDSQMTNWKIEEHICSDHALVTSTIRSPTEHKTKPPRWRIQESTLKEGTFRKRFIKATKRLNKEIKRYQDIVKKIKKNPKLKEKEREIENIRKATNPQISWQNYKETIRKLARLTQDEKRNNLTKNMKNLEHKIQETITQEQNQLQRQQIIELKEEQMRIITRRQKEYIKTKRINWKTHGEQCSKYYFNLKKPKQNTNIIERLKINRNDTETTENSINMADIATQYHKDLQTTPDMTEEREQAIDKILETVDTKINNKEKRKLSKQLKIDHLYSALKQSKNGKSPGEDGITYEFWKWAHKIAEEYNNDKENKDKIDPIKAMYKYLLDIENYGPINQNFAKGLLFPLYKKGDPEDIANYRPITLTNTDYKLYTKTMAIKITRASQDIIHEDQAGFMPGRSIYNHTRLINIIEEACEIEEINGYIVALDQEKAYDKIDHNFLWKAMEKFQVPLELTERIKRIYESATTQVIVNGHEGNSFPVGRGCRQGDPMSCILYNIAIEPLGTALRATPLRGIQISNEIRRVLTTMYADDTAITLHEDDDIEIARDAIKLFCMASTARFNDNKEEILAIGTEAFKKDFNESRTMKNGNRIPDKTKLITPHNPMRMLGAWHGNKGIAKDQWKRILEKQQDIIDLWTNIRPSIKGRILLLKSLVASRALYLAMVNGMPKDVEEKMTKQMSNFFWMGSKPQMTWEQLCQPIQKGGLNAPSIQARNKAIDMIWMKTMLTEPKPAWAQIAHFIINKQNNKTGRNIITDWPIQHTETNITKIPKIAQKIIRIAKRTNLGISPALPSETLRLNMPAMYHIAAKQNEYRKIQCLIETHKINTIKDLLNLTNRKIKDIKNDKNNKEQKCQSAAKCKKKAHRILEKTLPTKWTPGKGTQTDNLDHTPRRIQKTKEISYKKDSILYNPSTTSQNETWKELRIFREGSNQTWTTREKKNNIKIQGFIGERPPNETPRKTQAKRETINQTKNKRTIYTDGSSFRNGATNAEAGIGIWVEDHPEENTSIRMEVPTPNNQKAELAAILIALRKHKESPIEIRTDSETAVLGITKHATNWEDIGWHRVENADYYKAIISELRQRTNPCTLKWIKGHNGILGNEEADKLAEKGLEATETFTTQDLQYDPNFIEDGAKLHKINMKRAYEMIIDREHKEEWKNTKRQENLENLLDKVEHQTSYRPSLELLQKATWKMTIPNNIRDFIWKTQRGMLKCGPLFLLWGKEWSQRAWCRCGSLETPEHNIMECTQGEQKPIWKEITRILQLSNCKDWEINWTNILAAACLPAAQNTLSKDNEEETTKQNGRTQAFIRITLQAAWIIWKIRCLRIIEENTTTEEEAIAKVKAAIIRDCQTEWDAANALPKTRKQNKKRNTFIATWIKTKILKIENHLLKWNH
jgi:ribonuclease HI/endonuclease/exonuclease/phosphatase family metal-dependent hydrolase